MDLKGLFKAGGLGEKVINVVEKVVPDTQQKNELKFELYKIIVSSMVAKYVRALLAVMFFTVWLFFPEKMEGREEVTKYLMYAIAGYYFLVDRAFNKAKK